MDHHYPGSQFLRPLRRLGDGMGGKVSEFNTGDGHDVPVLSGYSTVLDSLADKPLQRAHPDMVGQSNATVASLRCPTYQFDRREFTVA
jgi:hypothetical protein